MSSDIFHELNPVLVAQVDAFAEMLEQRNLARDAAICLEQELAAAEAENAELRKRIEAIVLACQQAWHTAQGCECDAPSDARALIHSFLGPFGADWDLAALADLIRTADEVEWGEGFADHSLRVLKADRTDRSYFFDVKRPQWEGES